VSITAPDSVVADNILYWVTVADSVTLIALPIAILTAPTARTVGRLERNAALPTPTKPEATVSRLAANTCGSSTGLLNATDSGPMMRLVACSPMTALMAADMISPE